VDSYRQRLTQREASLEEADRRAGRFGNVRLVLVAAFLACLWYSQWWAAASLVLGFLLLGVRIQSLQQAVERARRSVVHYESAIHRINGDWAGRGSSGETFLPHSHLYARDLDLLGRGSLFELLSRARTRMGEATLAGWMLAPASAEVIASRQQAVQEVAPLLDLREDLSVLGEEQQRDVRTDFLIRWGEAPQTALKDAPRRLYFLISVLGLGAAVALLADLFGAEIPYLRIYYLSLWLVCGLLLARHYRDTHAVLHGAEGAAAELGLLAGVLERLESERFSSPHLQQLRARLDSEGQPPSRRIAQLRRWMDLADSRDHFLVRLLGPLVLWDLQLALGLEDWRKQSGVAMRQWVEAAGEIEALISLGCFSYENPEATFPLLLAEGPVFEGEGLTHPLMPKAQAVANSVHLGEPCRLLVVSGSNMSGKSTLMRTVGVNTVLALMGAPVFANRLRLSELAMGASLATHDSLQANTSRFYAEILRLRDIMQEASGVRPVLFLIDEILSGTNSHDRRIGAAAILRGLVERGSIGIATTHDLALTQIGDELGDSASNVHLEDQLIDGKMHFDYQVRPGVVQHSNAIALMRAVGLEV